MFCIHCAMWIRYIWIIVSFRKSQYVIKSTRHIRVCEVWHFVYSAELISVASDSAFQLHIKGRNLKRPLIINEPETNEIVETLNLLKPHSVLEVIYNYGVMNLGDCCQKTWSKLSQYETNYIRIRSKIEKYF